MVKLYDYSMGTGRAFYKIQDQLLIMRKPHKTLYNGIDCTSLILLRFVSMYYPNLKTIILLEAYLLNKKQDSEAHHYHHNLPSYKSY